MFCSKCGTENLETNTFCKNCGEPLATPVQPKSEPMLKKREYMKKLASKKAKTSSLVALILTFVLIASFVLSYFSITSTSVEKIPIVAFSVKLVEEEVDGESFDDLLEQIDEAVDEFEDNFETNRHELNSEEQDLAERFLEAGRACAEDASINNAVKLFAVAKEIDEYEDDAFNDIQLDEIDDVSDVLTVVKLAIIGFIVFILLFSALGGFFKVRGLVITGFIFSLIYSLAFCPIVIAIAIAIIHIALIVFISIQKSEYKAYKKSFR